MIWLTWRQSRAQILSIAVVVALLGVLMASFTVSALTGDPTAFLTRLDLQATTTALYIGGSIACLAAPPVIGAFWGAPLIARELETGTFRLAWNQGISRTRWLSIKLGALALTAALLTGLLSFALTWWAGPIDQATGQGGAYGVFYRPRIAPLIFSSRGFVPAAYAVAAVAVGVLIGLLVQRTVAALALTLIAVVALQVLMPMFVREHLMTPVSKQVTVTADNLRGMMIAGDPGQGSLGRVLELRVTGTAPNAWELSNRTLDGAGRVQSSLPSWVAYCGSDPMAIQGDPAAGPPTTGNRQAACLTRLAAEGYRQELRTQPGSRFWALQWRESALLLIIAAAAGGLTFVRLRR